MAPGALALALVAGVAGGWWHHRVAPAPAGLALPPLEARLLDEAARAPGDPRPYLGLAEQYAAANRPASALWAYTAAQARAPGDPAIRLKTAATVRQLGNEAVAAAILQPVIAGGGAAGTQARLDLADLLLATGQPGAALAALQGAGPEGEIARGRAEEAAGDAGAAARAYRHAGAAGDAEGYERLVRLELSAGDVSAAREALRGTGGLEFSQPQVLMLTAAVDTAGGKPRDLDAALQVLLQAVRLRPDNAEAYYQAGLIFQRQGNRAAARAQFERALKLDPTHLGARGRLAGLLQAMGHPAQAHRERAAYEELKNQPDRALAELRRASDAGYPQDLERTLAAVRIATELQQLSVAVAEDQAGLRRHPGDPDLMLQLGLIYLLGGSRAALERHCRDWMARQPASGLPYWLLGRRAVGDARVEDAIPLFETACAKDPENLDFCIALGSAAMLLPTPANVAKARVWLEKAVSMDARSAEAHQQLARALEQTGDLPGARRQVPGIAGCPGGTGGRSR